MAIINSCGTTSGPKHPDPDNAQTLKIPGCVKQPDGTSCSNVGEVCTPFQLSESSDSCFIDGLVNESLTIGGAMLHIHKLMGVHEQCKTVDVTGKGQAISNGDAPGFPSSKAYDVFVTAWRSIQKGCLLYTSPSPRD